MYSPIGRSPVSFSPIDFSHSECSFSIFDNSIFSSCGTSDLNHSGSTNRGINDGNIGLDAESEKVIVRLLIWVRKTPEKRQNLIIMNRKLLKRRNVLKLNVCWQRYQIYFMANFMVYEKWQQNEKIWSKSNYMVKKSGLLEGIKC